MVEAEKLKIASIVNHLNTLAEGSMFTVSLLGGMYNKTTLLGKGCVFSDGFLFYWKSKGGEHYEKFRDIFADCVKYYAHRTILVSTKDKIFTINTEVTVEDTAEK